jgi:hypothetical protein
MTKISKVIHLSPAGVRGPSGRRKVLTGNAVSVTENLNLRNLCNAVNGRTGEDEADYLYDGTTPGSESDTK